MKDENNAGDNAGRETEEMADRGGCLTCDGCRLKENCWNGSYYNTYGTLMELLPSAAKKGTVDPGDLPPVFRRLLREAGRIYRGRENGL